MKKTLLTLAFATAGIFTFTASAQQQCCAAQKECCKTEQACCKEGAVKPKANKPNAFEGITLTAEQQTQIKALNEKYGKARKDKKEAKAESAKKERKEAQEGRRAYLDELKKILTPEQYTTYLENQAMNKQGVKGNKRAPQKSKDGKKDGHKRPAKPGDKPVKQAKVAQ